MLKFLRSVSSPRYKSSSQWTKLPASERLSLLLWVLKRVNRSVSSSTNQALSLKELYESPVLQVISQHQHDCFSQFKNNSRIPEYCCTRYTSWDLKLKRLILFYPVQYIYFLPNNNCVTDQEISVTEQILLEQVLQIKTQTKNFQCREGVLPIMPQIPEIPVALHTSRIFGITSGGGPLISVGIFRPKYSQFHF